MARSEFLLLLYRRTLDLFTSVAANASVAITGKPVHASSNTLGKPSEREGITKTSDSRKYLISRVSPKKVILSLIRTN